MTSMRLPFLNPFNLVAVPASLADVTTRSPAEVDPRSVGVERAGVDAVWRAVERFYGTGLHPAMQLCVRRRGQVLIDRAIGHATGNPPDAAADAERVLADTDTPFCLFSASKAVTAMVIHLLDQQHRLHVNDPVSEYIPEFGRHGKERVTIEHVLTHRAGIPNMPPEEMRLENLAHPERIVRLLCDAKPTWAPGRRLAYHAITGGFILGEIVRRVTGRDIRAVLEQEILRPLDFRWMRYGVRPRDVGRVAHAAFTGPRPLPPIAALSRRALGVDFTAVPELSNDPRYLQAIIPSGNVVSNANELSRFYQLLLDAGELDGVRIFEPRTIHRATSEQSYLEFDLTLGVPTRYSMGFMLGGFGFYGPDTAYAFGHLGFINIIAWADPERDLAVALTNSGKPLFFPEIYYLLEIMRQIGRACPKVASRRRARPVRALRVVPRRRAS
ncbi:MAG TPA: serine hydrolase domain-containing protein [Candidatus Dormibacteraeota bacterium]|nr:serine hydrolase domain-containing protein [Candidatus Dormibacteraeota bacterium]